MVRVAIAHDYLTQRGGAERVVLSILRAFPDADIYTTVYDPDATFPEFRYARIFTTTMNRHTAVRRDHRLGLPFYPHAVGSAPAIDADVLITSTTGFAHGFRTTGRKLVYCHSPARFIYLIGDYVGGPAWRKPTGWALTALHPYLRHWDQRAAASADVYLANSTVVAERIQRIYGIGAKVVPAPPAVTGRVQPEPVDDFLPHAGGHYLIVSRLLPYKNVQHAIAAFRELPDERLVIVGKGPMAEELRRDLPSNVTMVSGISDGQLATLYAGARALIAPSFEDYGLTPLEAGAFGTPTLALRAGGYLDTVREGVSGAFFEAPTPGQIRHAVTSTAEMTWDAAAIRAHTSQFDEAHFHQALHSQVEALASGQKEGRR